MGSSSSALPRPTSSTESTASSERSPRAWTWSRRWSRSVARAAPPRRPSGGLRPASCKVTKESEGSACEGFHTDTHTQTHTDTHTHTHTHAHTHTHGIATPSRRYAEIRLLFLYFRRYS